MYYTQLSMNDKQLKEACRWHDTKLCHQSLWQLHDSTEVVSCLLSDTGLGLFN